MLGELACLSAAALWAVAVFLFRGPIAAHGARTINLAKCSLSALLLVITTAALGQGAELLSAPAASVAFLVASGLVGLVLGDTALFAAVDRLGVHRTFLLQTLAPIFTAAIAFAWMGERPTAWQGAGASVVLAGVALVVGPRPPSPAGVAVHLPGRPRDGSPTAGLLLGVVAAFGQGAGIVLAKAGMHDVAALPATTLRLVAAAAGLAVLAALTRRLASVAALARSRAHLSRVVPATLIGTYLAMILMMVGVKLAPAAIAAALLSTSPIFSLVLGAVLERRPPTPRALFGTLLAVAGAAVLVGSGR